MSASPMQLRVDGQWLSHVTAWGDLTWSTRFGAPGGSGLWEIGFSVARVAGRRTPLLHPGATVELMAGPVRLGTALLADPDWNTGRMVATGIVRAAQTATALAVGGAATTVPDAAIDAAIARGALPGWVRSVSLSSTAQAATTNGLNMLHTLLDSVAAENGQVWRMRADGDARFVPFPTDPTWQIIPGVAELGIARDRYASRIIGRYIRDSDGAYASASISDPAAVAAYGLSETIVDLTPLGAMSSSRALNYVTSMLNRGRARPSWLDTVDVSSVQLLTMGGAPAALRQVRAGQMVRIWTFDDTRLLAGRTYLDVTIGVTEYEDGADTIRIGPVDRTPETLTETFEQFVQQRAVTG